MNPRFAILAPALLAGLLHGPARAREEAIEPNRAANTVILDEAGVRNLRLQTEIVEKRDFETTVFAIGRLEEVPQSRSSLSSRIEGRVVELNAFLGDEVKEGEVIARVESRMPGDPPAVIDLEAPADGTVVESHVRLGEPVQPGKDLMHISDRSEMWAVAEIPENEAAPVGPGTSARLRIPALGGRVIEAKFAKYGVAADRESGTVNGIFVLPNPEGRMQPGMRVEFSIVTDSREDVLAVPRSAVQGDPTDRKVFVKDFELENAYVRAPVVLGERNDRYFEVVSGLFPGDEVVTRGSYPLSFAGSGSGPSLKEALDAAHGHEHNEDGSRVTSEQEGEGHGGHGHAHGDHGASEGGDSGAFGPGWLDIAIYAWAAVASLLLIVWAQQSFNRRRARTADA